TSTIVSSYPISTTTTIDNKINNNLIGTSPCENIDCQRLFYSTDISNQTFFFLHDLQSPIIARYIRIRLIRQ
ncbi:unnamed protein product, partial [Rotaria sordida]